jgi:pimeloyl-ACP methyl ester carboxylesterase
MNQATTHTVPWAYATTEVDGAKVRFVDVGQGEPVLLLHGYPQSSACWRGQIAPLAARHRVIAPDWPGFGLSPPCPDPAPTYEVEVARIGKLADQLGLSSFNLIAHDYGGFLALSYVAQHPARVLRLALLNSRAHGIFKPRFYRFSQRQRRVARHPVGRALLRLVPLDLLHARAFRHQLERGTFPPLVLHEYLDWMSGRAGHETFVRFFAHYQVERRSELASVLSGIRCPTAVIWGERDPFVPLATAHELAAQIPDAQLTSFPDAGHFIMEERPAQVTAALLELLARPLREAIGDGSVGSGGRAHMLASDHDEVES